MIHTFTNKPHQNIFNQNYKYFIFENNYLPQVKPAKLATFILKKEKNIINKTKKEFEKINKTGWQDGGTGLGVNSLTSRSPLYNLVEFKETKYLKDYNLETENQELNNLLENLKYYNYQL